MSSYYHGFTPGRIEGAALKHHPFLRVLGLICLCAVAVTSLAAEDVAYSRTEDVIYGRKFGTALTLDVYIPKQNANGAAVIEVVSGGWVSSHENIDASFWKGYHEEFIKRGYVVFAVVHGSQPKYAIPDAISDLNRAVRYIRHHAQDYKFDPNRIGITGGSAGGHLSLMQGTAGDNGNPDSTDPIDRESSRVQAVACFFPPTDFLNYGKPGDIAIGSGLLAWLKAPFDFRELDKNTNSFVTVSDTAKILEIGRQISPITHVTSDDPPTFILHGDLDKLVPIQQAEIIVAKLKDAGVPVELMVKKGADHGWANHTQDLTHFADWFDKYLK